MLGGEEGGQGLGMHPAQSTEQLVSTSPGGQGSFIRDSAQLGGFEPGWATTIRKTARIMSRDRDPGKPPDFPIKGGTISVYAKYHRFPRQASLLGSWSWKQRGLWRQRSWVQIAVWPLSRHVASGELLNSLPTLFA